MEVEVRVYQSNDNYNNEISEMISNYINDTQFKSWKTVYKMKKQFKKQYKISDEIFFNEEKVFEIHKEYEEFKKEYIQQNNLSDNFELFQNYEINFGNQCSLQCTYCYLEKFGDRYKNFGLYPTKTNNYNIHIKNLEKMQKYMTTHNLTPYSIDLFGGDQVFNKVGFNIIKWLYNFYSKQQWEFRPIIITIPSNFTWIQNEKLVNEVEDLIIKFNKIGIMISYSASVDGLFDKINRPQKTKGIEKILNRNDEYYDKVFKIQKKFGFGFHPMIYSNMIEYWSDNFLWFMRNYVKYGIPLNNLYLLEIRNVEWSQRQQLELGRFMRFLIMFQSKLQEVFTLSRKTISDIFHYNITVSPFSVIGRGIGCSLQTTFQINSSDLSVNQCHRQNYNYNYGFKLEIDNEGKKIKFIPNNFEYYLNQKSFHVKNQPYCEQCLVKDLCQGLCPQSQQEVFQDQNIPIPTTCIQEYMKIFGIITGLQDYLPEQLSNITYTKRTNVSLVMRFLNENQKIKELLSQRDEEFKEKINDFFMKYILPYYNKDTGEFDYTFKKEIPLFTEKERRNFL